MRKFDYSNLADRTWPTDLLNLVAKIHECKGRQDMFVRQKPIELNRLVEIAKIQSTESSNRIEGIVTTATRMRQLFAEKNTPKNRNEGEILGYRDVLNIIHENYEHIPIRASYIRQLHRDLLRPAGLSYGGNYKSVQNYINETRQDGTTYTRFTPMTPFETPEAIDALCTAYERAIELEYMDALIVIPCFIIDFLCIHPFNDGNGRMSRLLTLLLLYKSGYTVGKYISIEKKIEETKDCYYEVLKNADIGWYDEVNDPTPFIRYMLNIILSCYIEFEQRVSLIGKSGISSMAYDIVKKYVNEKIGKFTISEVVANCPTIGRASVLASLKKLIEEGIILRHGKGRASYYIKVDRL